MKAVEAMKKAEHESAAGPPDLSGRQSANVNVGFASVKLTNFYKKKIMKMTKKLSFFWDGNKRHPISVSLLVKLWATIYCRIDGDS